VKLKLWTRFVLWVLGIKPRVRIVTFHSSSSYRKYLAGEITWDELKKLPSGYSVEELKEK
jgi:hypothetical protein